MLTPMPPGHVTRRWRWIGGHQASRLPAGRRQSGAFGAMFAILLLVMLAFCGLAVDAAVIYNRKAELQGIAGSVALAAARELDGTPAGVDAALVKAGETARRLKYRHNRTLAWDSGAITFSNSPARGAEWVSADAARASAGRRFYAQVDTRALADDVGIVGAYILPLFRDMTPEMTISHTAIAGRSTIHVMPLAICAMSPNAGAARTNPGSPAAVELVEYGFRRGVTYNLMRLNPNGIEPANFALDPLAPPGGLGSASNTSASAIAPFVCSGRLWIPRFTGGAIRVGSPFPVASLYRQLNSRFDQYQGGACSPNGAPPDFNIKAYTPGTAGGAAWMNPRPSRQSAQESTAGGRLQTIADLSSPPAGTTGDMYGPLWAHSRAVKFSSYTPGSNEPRNGYARFAAGDWATLYPGTPPPAPATYPSATQPYHLATGAHYARPADDLHLALAVIERRVLHIPLLACPVTPGSNVGATALAIGKFFMTAPADAAGIYAEFSGIIPENQLVGEVILYP